MARLEKWILHSFQHENGQTYSYLTGCVFGHPMASWDRNDLIDGHRVRTSMIVDADWDNGVVTTQSGTVYELGEKYGGK